MSEKLKDYQVLDVLNGGTFYKVRHKVTSNIYTWKAHNCSAYSDDEIQNVVREVKSICSLNVDNALRYHDTILHAPSRTLYFVLEFNTWQSLDRLKADCEQSNRYIAESFIWYLLHELACVCKVIENVNCTVLRKCLDTTSIYLSPSGQVRADCFELRVGRKLAGLLQQLGVVLRGLTVAPISRYSTDLQDILDFLTDDKSAALKPDAILFHPTVLINLETLTRINDLSEIMLPLNLADLNKCDSQKAIELCQAVEPAPRKYTCILDSPIYSNVIQQRPMQADVIEDRSVSPISPTIAALALELPGFVPRSRKPVVNSLESYNPQLVSEKTLSQQWMTRLVALRQREESLNKRERDIIAKEIVNSPTSKIIDLDDSTGEHGGINGITLPPLVGGRSVRERPARRRRASCGRIKRRSRYEDLDSSLSADTGDSSLLVTTTKFTTQNMPRRKIFPEISTKKVHFASANPFVESDESVTLTFYELDNVDAEGYQVPKKTEKLVKDITKFKYLDLEKLTSEKRAAMPQWSHSSPSKQAKTSTQVLGVITNTAMRKTPSKSSLVSKYSQSSGDSKYSKNESDNVFTPARDVKKTKSRKSLLPFKFMSSNKV